MTCFLQICVTHKEARKCSEDLSLLRGKNYKMSFFSSKRAMLPSSAPVEHTHWSFANATLMQVIPDALFPCSEGKSVGLASK